MQLSRGSRDSTVMLLFLQKGNFSVPWDGTGLPLWAARAGGDRGHGCTQGRADPLGLELSRGPSTHQQLLWGSPLSLCIPKSYPHLTFAVRFHGARPSHPASARPLWDSLIPRGAHQALLSRGSLLPRPGAPRNVGKWQQG